MELNGNADDDSCHASEWYTGLSEDEDEEKYSNKAIRIQHALPRRCEECQEGKLGDEFPSPARNLFAELEVATICQACEARKQQVESRKKQERDEAAKKRHALPRKCKNCRKEKTGEAFRSPVRDLFGELEITTICQVCEVTKQRCEARDQQERDKAAQKQLTLPRKCRDCQEEKSKEEFPLPVRNEFDELEIATRCKACKHNKSINEALWMKRRFGAEYYKYEPKDDALFYVRKPMRGTQEKRLRQELLGKYHIVYIRLIDNDYDIGDMQRAIYTGGTVTLAEKKIRDYDEERRVNTTKSLLCGEISLGPNEEMYDETSINMPRKMKFDFVEASNGGISEEPEGEEPRPQRRIADWAIDLDLQGYRCEEDSDMGYDDLDPHGVIKIIDQRHPCRWVPEEHPFDGLHNSYDHDTYSFPSLQAAERIAVDHEDIDASWLCNHLHLPSAVAQIIHEFVAWRPRPVFFFEPGDLWLKTNSYYCGEGDVGLVKTSCYMIARPASQCEEKIRKEQALQKGLQSRYDKRL